MNTEFDWIREIKPCRIRVGQIWCKKLDLAVGPIEYIIRIEGVDMDGRIVCYSFYNENNNQMSSIDSIDLDNMLKLMVPENGWEKLRD